MNRATRGEPRDEVTRVILPGYEAVLPVLVAGCTAILSNDGADINWVGCPTSACGDPINNPCQPEIGFARVWCECDGGMLCRSKVAFNGDATVAGWLCETNACPHPCDKAAIPFPVPGGGPVYFYACDC